MSALFADSHYFFALLSDKDAAHEAAKMASHASVTRIVTHAWILTEVADGFGKSSHRLVALELIDQLIADKSVTIVPPTNELFHRGLELFRRRSDKRWSLTDCISFVVMRQHGLLEALTADRHFEQAGFVALLK
jgi:uncharacterized protein